MKVLVIDRSREIRDALHDVLDSEDDVQVVALSADTEAAPNEIERFAPDVAVLGIDMQGGQGARLVRTVRQQCPNVGLVALGAENFGPSADELVSLAAVYVTKDASNAEIISAVRRVENIRATGSKSAQSVPGLPHP